MIAGTSIEGAPVVACSAVTRDGLDELTATLERELAKAPRAARQRPAAPADRPRVHDVRLRDGRDGNADGRVAAGGRGGRGASGRAPFARAGAADARAEGGDRRAGAADGGEPGGPRRRSARARDGRDGAGLAEAGDGGRRAAAGGPLHGAADPAQPFGDVPHRRRRSRRASCCCSTATGCAPGEEAWAQVRLSEPVAAIKGDRFVIRDPNDTLGGGVIVDTNVKRHRRHHAPTIAALEAMEKGSPEELVLIALRRLEPAEAQVVLNGSGLPTRDGARGARHADRLGGCRRAARGRAHGRAGDVQHRRALAMTGRLRETLDGVSSSVAAAAGDAEGGAAQPARADAARAFDQLLAYWDGIGDHEGIGRDGRAAGARAARSDPQQEARSAGIRRGAAGESVSRRRTDVDLDEELLAYLEATRRDRPRWRMALRSRRRRTGRWWSASLRISATTGSVTLAQVRDMFGTSRKYAQALLEHMDAERITRRVGDARVLRKG